MSNEKIVMCLQSIITYLHIQGIKDGDALTALNEAIKIIGGLDDDRK